jgi:tyrosyl-tRNA synthetase
MTPFLAELRWRGLLHQFTHADVADAAFARGGVVGYIGFDPTASSLHVGSLLQILGLLRLRIHGHEPIAVIGDGTGLIGDPSGKTAERQLLDDATVRDNADAIQAQIATVFQHAGVAAPRFVRNSEWLCSAQLIPFLRDVGKHFSVNAMMARDSVKARLSERDQGISFTEFSYMLLQAWDFERLWADHGCVLQLGGSDQWGNIVSGVDLIQRLHPDATDAGHPFGVTQPLVTTKSGTKFGKTEQGTVWLDPARTSPFQFYQFWINADDDDAVRWLPQFTRLDREETEAIQRDHALSPEQRLAQRRLAFEVTADVHGAHNADLARVASTLLFGGDPTQVNPGAFELLAGELPTSRHQGTPTLGEIAVGEGRPFASNGEARRMLQAGGVRLNGEKLGPDALFQTIASDRWLHGRYLLLRVGKKHYLAIRDDG